MRVIARIDVKNEYAIKGIHLEGVRKVGDPNELALKYYNEGVDEIVFMDAVASLYDRNNLFKIIESACEKIFIPVTIGGGIRTLSDIEKALYSGADKVAINTAAIRNPSFIRSASLKYGSQCIVGSIEAKRQINGWEAYIDNGREKTGVDVMEWAQKLEQLGAGEILLTSIDQEGTQRGFEVNLAREINRAVSIPVIVSGGMGELIHISELARHTYPSALACAASLHYNKISVMEIKSYLKQNHIEVRI
ncbi:MAG: imidazole glycerol phosphate synthase subunit HisF [Nitrosomonadaceae bacterium]|nr:imidazole glycerol phosphate synthase subunit HisF [Nitrosomonadaceae bacterium]|tara:strand:+ start:920 stop:1666 length:747 start_codon:yes stop_codon:yes gene_type:complete